SAFRRVASAVASVVAGEDHHSEHQAGGHGFSRADQGDRHDPASAAEGTPHRPFKIIYATLYYDVRPTFVADITDQFEDRFAALMAYNSQFEDRQEGSGLFPA